MSDLNDILLHSQTSAGHVLSQVSPCPKTNLLRTLLLLCEVCDHAEVERETEIILSSFSFVQYYLSMHPVWWGVQDYMVYLLHLSWQKVNLLKLLSLLFPYLSCNTLASWNSWNVVLKCRCWNSSVICLQLIRADWVLLVPTLPSKPSMWESARFRDSSLPIQCHHSLQLFFEKGIEK